LVISSRTIFTISWAMICSRPRCSRDSMTPTGSMMRCFSRASGT